MADQDIQAPPGFVLDQPAPSTPDIQVPSGFTLDQPEDKPNKPKTPYKTDAPPTYAPQADPVTRFLKGAWSVTGAPLVDAYHAAEDVNSYLDGSKPELDPKTKQMVGNIWDSHVDQAQKAKQAWEQGNYGEAFGHGLATILPVIGPAAAHAGETIGAQQEPVFDKYGNVVKSGQAADIAGGLGQGAGLVVPAATHLAVEKIPRAGRAAANLEQVGQAVDAQPPPFNPRTGTFPPNTGPVDLSGPGKIALNAQKLPGASGGVMQDFLQRVTDPNQSPLTFSEVRDYYEAASQVPTKNLSVSMRQQLTNFKNALNQSMTDAAEQAGQGKQYASALREARQAATAKKVATTVGKTAVKYGAQAAGLGTAAGVGSYLWHLFGKASGGPVLDRYPSRESILGSLGGSR